MSQDVDVVPHVPGGGGSVLAIFSILKFHLTLHVGFLDHFHLQERSSKYSSCFKEDPPGTGISSLPSWGRRRPGSSAFFPVRLWTQPQNSSQHCYRQSLPISFHQHEK